MKVSPETLSCVDLWVYLLREILDWFGFPILTLRRFCFQKDIVRTNLDIYVLEGQCGSMSSVVVGPVWFNEFGICRASVAQ
jgi:hypothetical protein